MVNRIKQKALLPSLREKKRYLVFETISEANFSFKDLKDVIISNFKELFGLDGLAKAGLEFVEYKKNKGIIRVSTKGLDSLKATFCFVRKVNKEDIMLRSLGVSGMLKKARSKFVGDVQL
jgi:ribonuclease P/MRP protein subunit POP5